MVPVQNLSKQQQLHHQYGQYHHQNNLVLLLDHHKGSTTTTDITTYYGTNYKKYTTTTAAAEECFATLMMSRGAEGYENYSTTESCLGSDLVVGPMAEDESRTNSLNEAGSSSKDNAQDEIRNQDQDHEQGHDHAWLQLSIGGHTGPGSHSHVENKNHQNHQHQILAEQAARRGSGLMIELDLLPGGSRSSTSSRQQAVAAAAARSSTGPTFQLGPHESARGAAAVTSFGSATNNNNNNFSTTSLMYFQHPGGTSTSTSTSSNFPPHPHHHLNWAFRPNLIHPSQNLSNLIMAPSTSFSSSCSSSLMMPQLAAGSSYFGHHQFHHQLQPPPVESAAAGPSGLDFRVVNPPRRPQSGIWFTLQASQNQAKEPFLPQISKSFLRIRDGRMTVRLIIKYLVNKLRLDSESEIEITCRGQQLLPFLTLQHVRDNIWGPTVSLLPDFSTTDHIMVLHYARSA